MVVVENGRALLLTTKAAWLFFPCVCPSLYYSSTMSLHFANRWISRSTRLFSTTAISRLENVDPSKAEVAAKCRHRDRFIFFFATTAMWNADIEFDSG